MKLLTREHFKKTVTDVRSAVLLLRFHTLTPKNKTEVFTPYVEISRALNIPYNKVVHICNYYFTRQKKPTM